MNWLSFGSSSVKLSYLLVESGLAHGSSSLCYDGLTSLHHSVSSLSLELADVEHLVDDLSDFLTVDGLILVLVGLLEDSTELLLGEFVGVLAGVLEDLLDEGLELSEGDEAGAAPVVLVPDDTDG